MTERAARMWSAWEAGATLDISREIMRLTLGVVGKTLFDAEVESEADDIGEALTTALGLFDMIWMPFPDLLLKLPLPATRRFHRARERLDATIYSMIEERRRRGEDRGDLLSMLLLAQETEGSPNGRARESDPTPAGARHHGADGGGDRMTDLQLRDEAITIFLAGHETTANALTWTWYLLSQNPGAEARLHAELAGKLPAVDDLPALEYTRAVLAESMRLYPPA